MGNICLTEPPNMRESKSRATVLLIPPPPGKYPLPLPVATSDHKLTHISAQGSPLFP